MYQCYIKSPSIQKITSTTKVGQYASTFLLKTDRPTNHYTRYRCFLSKHKKKAGDLFSIWVLWNSNLIFCREIFGVKVNLFSTYSKNHFSNLFEKSVCAAWVTIQMGCQIESPLKKFQISGHRKDPRPCVITLWLWSFVNIF